MQITRSSARRSKSWTDAQRLEFGRRLTWARTNAGYEKASDAIKELEQRFQMKVRTYYSHEAGERVPDDDNLIAFYAQLYGVPLGYLLLQQTEPETARNGEAYVNQVSVNQPIEHVEFKSSQTKNVRYISILTASDIKEFIAGRLDLSTYSGESLPVPRGVAAGEMTIAYQIPNNDSSMTGTEGGHSFPPNTPIGIDPDREIAPGDFLLAHIPGTQNPVLRQLKSPYPYVPGAPRYPFKLLALNPLVEPLTVSSAEDCTIVGRLIFKIQTY